MSGFKNNILDDHKLLRSNWVNSKLKGSEKEFELSKNLGYLNKISKYYFFLTVQYINSYIFIIIYDKKYLLFIYYE
jgi:hypothetical protein